MVLTECRERQYFDDKVDVKRVVERVPKIGNGDGVGGLDRLYRSGHDFECCWLYGRVCQKGSKASSRRKEDANDRKDRSRRGRGSEVEYRPSLSVLHPRLSRIGRCYQRTQPGPDGGNPGRDDTLADPFNLTQVSPRISPFIERNGLL